MNILDLTGKTILITGGCGAIGRTVVRVLIEQGARGAVNDIIPEDEATQVLAAAEATGPNGAYFRADVTQQQSVDALFKELPDAWEFPNVVCCHAGMVESYPVEHYPVEEFDKLLNLNLRSAYIVAQTAARSWIENNRAGHLIFTTSWVQDVPWPEVTPYAISKSGMKAMMRGFARELSTKNIRANAIAPGIVAVGLAKRQWDTDPGYRARARKAILLAFMQPQESVAHAFLFLCSDMANYTTGSVLLIDCGCSIFTIELQQ